MSWSCMFGYFFLVTNFILKELISGEDSITFCSFIMTGIFLFSATIIRRAIFNYNSRKIIMRID